MGGRDKYDEPDEINSRTLCHLIRFVIFIAALISANLLYLESHSALTGRLLTSIPDIEMPTDKNIRCTIHTKDGPLHEYCDGLEDQSSSAKSVYIQAENAVTFWFVFETLAGYLHTVGDCVTATCYIDGKPMGCTGVTKTRPCSECRVALFDGVSKSFQFTEISSSTPPTW